ncbi:MAG: N(4)-(beta-N-acetylglucosaminyl)-L-asparaginase [Planctomycetota bacterium]
MTDLSRREFLRSATVATPMCIGVGSLTPALGCAPSLSTDRAANGDLQSATRSVAKDAPPVACAPVVISSANGLRATGKAAAMIRDGADTLDAVIAGVNLVEEDPDDTTVGYGGLPNEDGVVELDSCVMHGPTHGAGAVAALRNIKTPSRVAKLVMQRTDHVLLVGEGALRFARAHGFKEVDLLTDKARRRWVKWKEHLSDEDDWIPDPQEPENDAQGCATADLPFSYGTINCCGLSETGDMSGVTTTSGLSFKIPGRVGDSPIIGAGLYVDNKVGAAGSTGRGEAVIKICGSHTIVEAMRHGMSPVDACLFALRRIVETTTEPRLKHPDGRPKFNVKFYALAKDGRFGAASMWSGAEFAVFANGKNRLEDCAFLYERPEEQE